MKALVIGAGVVLVLSGAGYAQYSLNQVVEAELDRMTDSEFISAQLGMPVAVSNVSQQSGLFDSAGSLTIKSALVQADYEIDIEYRFDHTIVSGVQYEMVIPDLRIENDGLSFSFADDLFQGQAIRILGEIDSKGGKVGQMLVPEANAKSVDGLSLAISPYPVDYEIRGFTQNATTGDYKLNFTIPMIELSAQTGVLKVEGLSWGQGYEGSDKVLKGDFTMGVAKMTSESAKVTENFELKNAAIQIDTTIDDNMLNTMEVTLASLTSPVMGELNNVAVTTRTGGLDGALVIELVNKVNEMQRDEQADPAMAMVELQEYLGTNLDALVAPSPYFEVQKLQFDLNGERFVDATGKVSLQSDKLPSNYFLNLMRQGSEPDAATMMSAINAKLDSAFGPQAAMMIGPMHPMLMAVLQSGEPIAFQLENGQMTLNGQPL